MGAPHDDDTDDTPEVGPEASRADRRIATITRRRKEAEEALRAAEERIDALEGEIAEHKRAAKQWESVQAERDALVAEREAWAEEKAMVGIGLTDPEGIDLARLAYGRIKPEDRPKGGIAEWLSDRDALPKGVRSYLEDAPKADPKAAEPAPKAAPPAARKAPDTDAKARHAPGAPPTFTGGAVSQMSADEVAASREAIWASLGRTPPTVTIPGIGPKGTK